MNDGTLALVAFLGVILGAILTSLTGFWLENERRKRDRAALHASALSALGSELAENVKALERAVAQGDWALEPRRAAWDEARGVLQLTDAQLGAVRDAYGTAESLHAAALVTLATIQSLDGIGKRRRSEEMRALATTTRDAFIEASAALGTV